MDMDRALLERALETLGAILKRRGLRFELVVDPSEGFRGVLVQTLQALGVEGADAEV